MKPIIVLSLTLLLIQSCYHMPKPVPDTFMLVHGGFHGAWCWYKLQPLLEQKGFQVLTPDHTGGGKAFYTYTDSIGTILKKQQQPVILVGHSSGGMVISELAKRYPAKIKGLVYLSAFLLPEGMSPPEIMRDDTISMMSSALIVDQQQRTVRVDLHKARQLFYADCEDSVAQAAIARLAPEPITPGGGNAPPPAAPQNIIKRFYIETLQDKALGITSQRRMQRLLPCEKVYTINSGHSPFLSQPQNLAAILTDISQRLKNE